MNKKQILFFLFILFIITSCKKEKAITKEFNANYKQSVKYAKGFEIQDFPNYKKLIIKSPYPNAKESQTVIFVKPLKK